MKRRTAKKTLKTAIRIALLVLAALVVGLNVYGINASRLAGDPVPMPFGIGAAVVLSGSMEPEISVGDLLIVVARDHYALRDVVVYQDGRMAVTHRIVAFTEEGIVTRGDANNVDDRPIAPEQIKGEVVCAIPLVGYAVNGVKSPLGTLCVLGLAIFLLERSFRAERQKDAEEMETIRAEIERLKQKNDP
jgi:signal peptidase